MNKQSWTADKGWSSSREFDVGLTTPRHKTPFVTKCFRILVGNPEGKRPLGRPRRRWEDMIRIDLREIGWGGMDWIDLAQDRDQWRALVNKVMNIRVP
jgi:hypothetical protein